MSRTYRAGAAALVAITLTAAPAAAIPAPPPAAPLTVVDFAVAFYGVAVILCTGMTFGKQDVAAARVNNPVPAAARFGGFFRCLLPGFGLANIAQ